MNNQQPCIRDDLVVVLEAFECWTPSKEGPPEVFADQNPIDVILGYDCRNCDKYFTPSVRYDVVQQDLAWRAALEHLTRVPAEGKAA